jgi:hypothetical protein
MAARQAGRGVHFLTPCIAIGTQLVVHASHTRVLGSYSPAIGW